MPSSITYTRRSSAITTSNTSLNGHLQQTALPPSPEVELPENNEAKAAVTHTLSHDIKESPAGDDTNKKQRDTSGEVGGAHGGSFNHYNRVFQFYEKDGDKLSLTSQSDGTSAISSLNREWSISSTSLDGPLVMTDSGMPSSRHSYNMNLETSNTGASSNEPDRNRGASTSKTSSKTILPMALSRNAVSKAIEHSQQVVLSYVLVEDMLKRSKPDEMSAALGKLNTSSVMDNDEKVESISAELKEIGKIVKNLDKDNFYESRNIFNKILKSIRDKDTVSLKKNISNFKEAFEDDISSLQIKRKRLIRKANIVELVKLEPKCARVTLTIPIADRMGEIADIPFSAYVHLTTEGPKRVAGWGTGFPRLFDEKNNTVQTKDIDIATDLENLRACVDLSQKTLNEHWNPDDSINYINALEKALKIYDTERFHQFSSLVDAIKLDLDNQLTTLSKFNDHCIALEKKLPISENSPFSNKILCRNDAKVQLDITAFIQNNLVNNKDIISILDPIQTTLVKSGDEQARHQAQRIGNLKVLCAKLSVGDTSGYDYERLSEWIEELSNLIDQITVCNIDHRLNERFKLNDLKNLIGKIQKNAINVTRQSCIRAHELHSDRENPKKNIAKQPFTIKEPKKKGPGKLDIAFAQLDAPGGYSETSRRENSAKKTESQAKRETQNLAFHANGVAEKERSRTDNFNASVFSGRALNKAFAPSADKALAVISRPGLLNSIASGAASVVAPVRKSRESHVSERDQQRERQCEPSAPLEENATFAPSARLQENTTPPPSAPFDDTAFAPDVADPSRYLAQGREQADAPPAYSAEDPCPPPKYENQIDVPSANNVVTTSTEVVTDAQMAALNALEPSPNGELTSSSRSSNARRRAMPAE